jgi:hypothetical protein
MPGNSPATMAHHRHRASSRATGWRSAERRLERQIADIEREL